MTDSPVRIVVADDQAIVRDGLVTLLVAASTASRSWGRPPTASRRSGSSTTPAPTSS